MLKCIRHSARFLLAARLFKGRLSLHLQNETVLCTHKELARWRELELAPIDCKLSPLYAALCPEDLQDEAWFFCQVKSQHNSASMLASTDRGASTCCQPQTLVLPEGVQCIYLL